MSWRSSKRSEATASRGRRAAAANRRPSVQRLIWDRVRLTLAALAVFAVFRALGVSCLIYALTGVPCPACFMTRALLSLLCGDLRRYAAYNLMAAPTAAAAVGELFAEPFVAHKKALHGYAVAVLAVNLLYYLIRLKLRLI